MLNRNQIKAIDKAIPVPLYYQLKEWVLSEIKKGTYKSGGLIPTEKELSESFQISRTTVRQAITELVSEGWLYRVKSKGTFVSQPKINQDFVRKVESFNDQIIRSGMTPSTEVLECSTQKATDEIARNLEIQVNSQVIYLHRKRLADGEPIVTVKTYLPHDKCAFVLGRNLEEERLYSILGEQEETRIFRVHRLIEAVEARTADVNLLDIRRGKPIQHFTSVGFNAYGRPIEYSLARYRGDRNSFEVVLSPDNVG